VSDGKNVYITIPGNYLYAVDLLLGTITWKTNLKDAWESLAISNDKEKLYIQGEKNFHIVSSKTGKQIKEIKMNYGEDQSSIKPVEWNNKIIFGEGNGNIYLIDQKYDWKKLIFAGTAGLTDIIHIKDNVFGVSNVDGKIVLFNVN
jgi:outer membrane protein assembly factor BamB